MHRVPYETKVDGVCEYMDTKKSTSDLQPRYGGIQYWLKDPEVLEGVSKRKEISVAEVEQLIEKRKTYNKERAKKNQRGVFNSIFPFQQ